MLATVFQAIILTSCIGAGLGILIFFCKSITQKKFSATWNYYIWLVVLCVMVLPAVLVFSNVNSGLAKAGADLKEYLEQVEVDSVTDKQQENMRNSQRNVVSAEEAVYDISGHRLVSTELQDIRAKEWNQEKWHRWVERTAPIWMQIAVVVFALRVVGYLVFLCKVARTTKKISCPQVREYTKRKVAVRTADWVVSPLLFGVLRPVLLLPHWEFTQEQLHNILAHETTHLKRNDMVYKWLVVVVKSLHWFNPVVYLVGHQVTYACEISCDLAVTDSMSIAEKKSYVETILALFTEQRTIDYAMTMGMGGTKGMLKKRFVRMKNSFVVGKGVRRVSNFSAAVLLMGALFLCTGLIVYANAMGMWECSIDSERSYPYVTRCSGCGDDVLFHKRAVVGKADEVPGLYYYVYFFECEDCSCIWRERELVEREYIAEVTNAGKTYLTHCVETIPKVLDSEADKALAAEGIVLSEEAKDAKDALKIIRKAVEKHR